MVIANPEQMRVAVNYVVDGVSYKTESGRVQRLVVGPSSTIIYDRGGAFGVDRYALSAGVYEFRASDRGWVLVKLRATEASKENRSAEIGRTSPAFLRPIAAGSS